MKVQSINNQYRSLNFGTKVTVEKDTRTLIDQLQKDAIQKIDNAIQQLEKNGIDDKLHISHCYDVNPFTGEKGQVILRGWTTSIHDGKKYKTWLVGDGRDFLIDTIYNRNNDNRPNIADIFKIYKNAKANERPIGIA